MLVPKRTNDHVMFHPIMIHHQILNLKKKALGWIRLLPEGGKVSMESGWGKRMENDRKQARMAITWREGRWESLQRLGSRGTRAADWEGGNGVAVKGGSPNCTLMPTGTPFGKGGCHPMLLRCGHGLSAPAHGFLTAWGSTATFIFTDLTKTPLYDWTPA